MISKRYQTGIKTFFLITISLTKSVESLAELEEKAADFFSMQLTFVQLYSLLLTL